jgi:ElaA protein
MTSIILPKIAPGITTRWQRFDELSAPALYELLRFRQQIFVVEQRSPYPDLDGLDQRAAHLLLRNGGDLAGCLRLLPRVEITLPIRIGRVAIAAGHRRRGLGRKLMVEALSFCGQHYSGQPIGLSAQLHLARFYESFGFITVGQPYEDFGVAHVEMEHSELA